MKPTDNQETQNNSKSPPPIQTMSDLPTTHSPTSPATMDIAASNSHNGSLAKLNIPAEVLHVLPADFAKRYRILPVKVDNETICIATAAPGNIRVIEDIRLITGL